MLIKVIIVVFVLILVGLPLLIRWIEGGRSRYPGSDLG